MITGTSSQQFRSIPTSATAPVNYSAIIYQGCAASLAFLYSNLESDSIDPLLLKSLGTGVTLFSGALAGSVYGARAKSAQIFGASSYHGSRTRRAIALTFDDGPSDGSLRLIDYLAEQDVKATFFQCGLNVVRHRSFAHRIFAAGHEIGNHTYSHARLCPRISLHPNLLLPSEILHEFQAAQDAIFSETGAQPVLLRAPYGFRWFGIGAAQKKLHLHGVLWSAIGNDWELDVPGVVSRLLRRIQPGSILCLHDGRDIRPDPDISVTLDVTRKVVPILRDLGYHFETVSKLLEPEHL